MTVHRERSEQTGASGESSRSWDIEKAITELFDRQGGVRYTGPREEAVSALEHALQCAQLAEEAGASAELTIAALVHDIGHFVGVNDLTDDNTDDCHERIGSKWLSAWFPEAVTEPVRLHVDAKRALCASSDGYYNRLSPASKHSLSLQGGVFDDSELKEFLDRPYAKNAMQLRAWDDLAKSAGIKTPPLRHYLKLLGDIRGLSN